MRARRLLPLVTVCVFVAFAALSVGAWWTIRNGVDRQERALLQSQTSDAVILMQQTIERTSLGLGSVGVGEQLFDKQAAALRPLPIVTVALITKGRVVDPRGRVAPGPPQVRWAVGPALHHGEVLVGALRDIVLRAGPTLSSSPVIEVAGRRSIVYSIVPPSIGLPGYVALEVTEVAPAQALPRSEQFKKIDFALYASAEPRRDQLLASTTGLRPLPKPTVTARLNVAALQWSVVAGARTHLLDSATERTPWLVLGLGLLLALSFAVIAGTLLRRQRSQRIIADTQSQHIRLMQSALLPDAVPTVSGIAIGWHYRTGGEPSSPVGGDWLAFVPIDDHRAGIAVGDVVGHGINAVRNMAQYRFALRTLATRSTSPCEVVDEVDRTARFFNVNYFSTCIYGVIDTANSTWTQCVAGHPPPMLVREGHVTLVDGVHGPPLAASTNGRHYQDVTVPLQRGDVLVLYSDGLIERRRERLEEGIERLQARLREIGTEDDLAEVSRAVVNDLVGATPLDDVVIILVRFTNATTPPVERPLLHAAASPAVR